MRPEYNVLFEKVREAYRQSKNWNFSKAEREILTLILSHLREGIVQEKFYGKGRNNWPVKLFEIKYITTQTSLQMYFQGYAIVKVVKHSTDVDFQVITKFFEQLGLKIKENYSKQIEVFFEFKSEEETL